MDELFENYLSRPNVRQPILTQYCDGRKVECQSRGWMTQWGSKALGDRGYSAIEILRYFYGNDMYINVAEEISGVPASWPGYDLDIGASGSKVLQIQEQLNAISQAYPALPRVNEDGIYGKAYKGFCAEVSEHFRSSGNRDCGLQYLVQNPGNLCRCHPDRRASIKENLLGCTNKRMNQ